MTADSLTVDLVTPEKLLSSKEVSQVEVPASEGNIGVLPGHVPLITALKPGVVTLINGGDTEKVFVAGGFVEVTNDRCTVLATEAIYSDKIDEAEAKERLTEALYKLDKAENIEDKTKAEEAVTIAQAMVDVAS